VRACADDCGNGVATCENGVWSPCQVAPSEGTCANACGNGAATCEGGEWGACRVAPTELACSDACGAGTAACVDGRLLGCIVPPRTTPCSTLCGSGTRVCDRGAETACDAPLPGPPTWAGTARDFLESHPDFELPFENDRSELGLVNALLGKNRKPVYAGGAGTVTTSGAATFDEWFHDAAGTNRKTYLELAFEADGSGAFVYSGKEFFPLDGRLLGNEGRPHNYHFTVELHAEFDFAGGEFLDVEGDDDIWVFINRHLVVDLGGLHEARSASVDLGAERGRLGLEPGGRYRLDLFFAERHTVSSSLNLRTSLTAREWCP
jgi:fibro-slime domain-containing protein